MQLDLGLHLSGNCLCWMEECVCVCVLGLVPSQESLQVVNLFDSHTRTCLQGGVAG